MKPEDVSALLRKSASDQQGPGATCPDEHLVAAYVDGSLPVEPREALELHLADCGHCLALVGVLSQERGTNDADAAPTLATPRAQPQGAAAPRRAAARLPQWAAAAVVVVAVSTLVRLSMVSGTDAVADEESAVRTTRSATQSMPDLKLLSPGPGETVSSKDLLIRWTSIPGSRYYDVRVVTDTGDVVAEQHVAGTELRLPRPVNLASGIDYFVHVDAVVSEDKTVSSEHVAFRVAD